MDWTRRSVAMGVALAPLAAYAQRPARKPSARKPVELHIESDGDELAFKPDHLTCPAGADVRLFFRHTGEIVDDPHDWVLLKPGAKKVFLADADKEPDETIVVPANDAKLVLAATPICGKGKTVMVEFTAPAPGDYTFVCSVPGHGETMQGFLTVTS